MSDRYNQLNLLDLVETKVEREMYPNFVVGDRVTITYTYTRPDLIGLEGTVIEIMGSFGIKIKLDCGTHCVKTIYNVKKVRVHQALEADSEAAAQDHKSPSIHYEIKEIKGRFYKYARWWDGDRHKSKYIGRALANS